MTQNQEKNYSVEKKGNYKIKVLAKSAKKQKKNDQDILQMLKNVEENMTAMRRKIKDIKKELNGTYRDKKYNIRGEIFDLINSNRENIAVNLK